MKSRWLAQSDDSTLTLLFGGWALGDAPFRGLTGGGNILLVEGYTSLNDPLPDLARFDHIDMLAFSFGVASAAHWLACSGFRPDRLIAISGTLHPACPERGIAPDMIKATAAQLSERSFARFCRRAGLPGEPPELDIAAARRELFAVIQRGSAPDPGFDRVWIPTNDRIIPTAAQETAWASTSARVEHVAGPHVPFLRGQSWASWVS
ncbi:MULTISPECIES: pimeloyl-ACP methyl esterase BioG family protein [unclassified Ruegeria]|uniref:pimeloyl-ACP methyl esterase BioG family protein n=1 Tax=unclassified Ruegeria TaxID=2625375 RepID=UPI001AE1E29E|nr:MULTISPECIES: pimeloyl-ACP methyl esterase BioG family protein [unclassified Ruegeria]